MVVLFLGRALCCFCLELSIVLLDKLIQGTFGAAFFSLPHPDRLYVLGQIVENTGFVADKRGAQTHQFKLGATRCPVHELRLEGLK